MRSRPSPSLPAFTTAPPPSLPSKAASTTMAAIQATMTPPPASLSNGDATDDTKHGALFNPFCPTEFSKSITANRRRWIHVFPVDCNGLAKLAHHYVAGKSTHHVRRRRRELQNARHHRRRFAAAARRRSRSVALQSTALRPQLARSHAAAAINAATGADHRRHGPRRTRPHKSLGLGLNWRREMESGSRNFHRLEVACALRLEKLSKSHQFNITFALCDSACCFI